MNCTVRAHLLYIAGNLRSNPAFWTTLARRGLMYVALVALLIIAIFFSACARDPDSEGRVGFCFSAPPEDVPAANETSTHMTTSTSTSASTGTSTSSSLLDSTAAALSSLFP